ncbi:MAG: hypothetical protein IPL95_07125 [Saprospiraceae bacterium]|nr:hypothetical protein [Saprospiraceae bacterium]
MKNKVSFLLTYFDVYELNKLRKFIQSPYFNSNEILVQLFDILRKELEKDKRKELPKESIWKLLYKNKPYDDVRYRKLNSELLKLTEEFLAQEEYNNNPMRQSNYLMDSIGKKKITSLYSSTIKNARNISTKIEKIEPSHYFYLYEMEQNFFELEDYETNRSEKANLEVILNNLDNFYFSEKLKWYCTILPRLLNTSNIYDLKFINEILEYINSNKIENDFINIYNLIVKLYKFPYEKSNFNELLKTIEINSSKFTQNEQFRMFNHLLNFCVSHVNKGDLEYHEHYIDINENLISNGLIFTDGYLSPWRFKNIVQIALRINKFEWTENFIEKYKKNLHPDFRENAVTFNLALLYFYQRSYDKVIYQLQNVEYEDDAYNLSSKSMLLAVYYEMDYIEPLYSLFDSFRAYLNRNKTLSDTRKLSYVNLIKFTKQLSRIIDGDFKSIEKLKSEILQEKNIASDKWLMEKIKEKENSK